ncbi:MAG: hypothetical protein R2731_00850 [Nocardioides sp.]
MPPKAFADLKAHQMHYKASNVALQQKFRAWPVAPRVPLPPADPESLSGAADDTPGLEATQLSTLLLVLAARRRSPRTGSSGGRRAAATSSVLARVAVRDVPGVEPGLYAYRAEDHALARLAPDPSVVPGDAPATVVLSGDYPVAQKYSLRSAHRVARQRLCPGDAPTGLPPARGGGQIRSAYDDERLVEVLDLEPDTEPITAVIDLGGQP